ncbi:MAG: glycosyltransferase [Phycisphaerales bacterium]
MKGNFGTSATVPHRPGAPAPAEEGRARRSVAIVLSNYNHGRYLPTSLGAICSQSRPADQILVIDDGSEDDSVAVIESFAGRHPEIEFLRNPRNLGLQASIRRVLPLVKTDYLVWAASDDKLLPDFLERSMAVLERHPDAGLCFSELGVIQGDSERVEHFARLPAIRHTFDLSDLPEYMAPRQVLERMRRAYLPISSNTVVARRDALAALGWYPQDLEWHSDSFAYTVVALRHGACVVGDTLALIRASDGSYSQAGMRDEVRQARVLRALRARLRLGAYRDIRRAFRRAPSNMSPWGTLMLRILLRHPRDWDLFFPYLFWKMREYRRGHGLSWGRTVTHMWRRANRALALRIALRLARRVGLTVAPAPAVQAQEVQRLQAERDALTRRLDLVAAERAQALEEASRLREALRRGVGLCGRQPRGRRGWALMPRRAASAGRH